MKTTLGIVCGILLVLASAPFATKAAAQAPPRGKEPGQKAQPTGVEGYWLGTLKVGTTNLRLGAKITRQKEGSYTGSFDSLDQGIVGLDIDEVTFKDRVLRFTIKKIDSVFEGKLKADGTEIDGKWKQSGLSFALLFKREAKRPTITRPQDPKKPYPYLAEEVSYENPKAKVKFAGTLTLPKGKGPFPAALLITGSGPQDRDEELLGHRPFLVLADHLTRRGIAVLRVDDRGVGGSTGNTMQSTTADFAEDALAGVEFLKGRKEIDPVRIGLIGHSEGGVVGPLAASRSKDVAFVVMLAGTGVPGDEIVYLQGQLIGKALGQGQKALARSKRLREILFGLAREEADTTAAAKRFDKLWESEVAKLPEDERKAAKAEGGAFRAQLKGVVNPWFRYFLKYDPRPALQKVSCPVLALFGEKDLQVSPRQNLPEVAKALADGACRDYTVTQVPGVNHLFQTCKTGSPAEYGTIQETMAPAVLETISDWILKRLTK
jgi:pimeloyl-ACP methyl ester carboxylesterase